MESANIDSMCRCCAAEGMFKDIKTSYHWMGEEEVYGDMLRECFDVKLSSVEEGGICEVCITQLRNAANFKKQVLHTEKKFKRHLETRRFKPTEVKEEVSADNDNSSDDDRGADSEDDEDYVPEFEIPIKTETPEESKSRKRSAKATTSRAKKSRVDDDKSVEDDTIIKMEPGCSFKVEDISYKLEVTEKPEIHNTNIKTRHTSKEKILMHRDKSVKLNNSDISSKLQIKMEPKTAKTEIKTVKESLLNQRSKSKTSLKYIERIAARMELEKHVHNIRTILLYSNATPIRVHYLGSGYVCSFCNASFVKAADLKNHTIVDHDNKMKSEFKPKGKLSNFLVKLDITSLCCNICNIAPATLDQLVEHLNSIHAKNLFTDIKNHIVSFKLDNEVFKCHICSADFNSFRALLTHMNKYFPNFICDVCGAVFVNRHQAYIHSDIHRNGSFKCNSCEKVLRSEAKRKSHERQTHIALSGQYRCFYCGDLFQNPNMKKKHMVAVHGAKYADLICNACDKTFKSTKALQDHKKKDHSMIRWLCKLCDKAFFSASRLKRHEVIHSGVRNFTCEVCSKCFGRKCSLIEHMRTHSKKASVMAAT